MVSWLPFYHDMGLLLGILAPVLWGFPAVLTSPMAFLQKPARWMQMLASNRSFSAAPNFAFELAVRRTSDDDMAGLDLGNVHTILSGSERSTPRRSDVSPSGSPASASLTPSLGRRTGWPRRWCMWRRRYPGRPPTTVRFDYEKLAAGHAKRCESEQGGSELVSLGAPARLHRADRRSRDLHRESGRQGRGDLGARRQRRAPATGETRNCRSGPSVDGSSIHRPARRRAPGFGPEIWVSSPTASCSSSAASKIC